MKTMKRRGVKTIAIIIAVMVICQVAFFGASTVNAAEMEPMGNAAEQQTTEELASDDANDAVAEGADNEEGSEDAQKEEVKDETEGETATENTESEAIQNEVDSPANEINESQEETTEPSTVEPEEETAVNEEAVEEEPEEEVEQIEVSYKLNTPNNACFVPEVQGIEGNEILTKAKAQKQYEIRGLTRNCYQVMSGGAKISYEFKGWKTENGTIVSATEVRDLQAEKATFDKNKDHIVKLTATWGNTYNYSGSAKSRYTTFSIYKEGAAPVKTDNNVAHYARGIAGTIALPGDLTEPPMKEWSSDNGRTLISHTSNDIGLAGCDQMIRGMTTEGVSNYYDSRNGNEAAGYSEYNISLMDFPSDEEVIENLKEQILGGLTLKVSDGENVIKITATENIENFDTENYTVRWYSVKFQSNGWHVDGVVIPKTYENVEIPEAANYTYDGTEKEGVAAGEGYEVSGTAKAKEAGEYTAVLTLKEGYKWTDGSREAKEISWSIAPVIPVASEGDAEEITEGDIEKAEETNSEEDNKAEAKEPADNETVEIPVASVSEEGKKQTEAVHEAAANENETTAEEKAVAENETTAEEKATTENETAVNDEAPAKTEKTAKNEKGKKKTEAVNEATVNKNEAVTESEAPANTETAANIEEAAESETDEPMNEAAETKVTAGNNMGNESAERGTEESVGIVLVKNDQNDHQSASTATATTSATADTADQGATIEDGNTPLAGPTSGKTEKSADDHWALINLILAALTVLFAAAAAVRNRGRKEENNDEDKKKSFRAAALIPAIGAIVAFILTENMTLSMALTDKWTLLMAAICAVQAAAMIIKRKKDDEEQEEEAYI